MEVWTIIDIEQPPELISSKLAEDDLYPTEAKLEVLDKNINDLIAEQRFFDARHRKFRENVNYVRWRSVIITIISTACVILLTGWQLCYIKRLVDSKQSNKFGI